jgi:putative membrane protein
MKRASEWFSEDDRKRIREAVAAAERGTAGEIVPVAATSSGEYERVEDIAGLSLGLAFVGTGWALLQGVVPASGDWAGGTEPALGLLPVMALFLGGFAAGLLVTRLCPPLKRALLPGRLVQRRVARAAAEAFERFHVKGTRAATGVVLYVSMFERLVVVQGDQKIVEKVDEAAWKGVVEAVTGRLRAGKPADGFCDGVAAIGALLAKHFPRPADDKDELANDLRVVD